jgi:hypothetical protein
VLTEVMRVEAILFISQKILKIGSECVRAAPIF